MYRWCKSTKTIESAIKENITRMQSEGKTVMVLGTEKEILARCGSR